jgi:hypothetical protein
MRDRLYRVLIQGTDDRITCIQEFLSKNEIGAEIAYAHENYPWAKAIWREEMQERIVYGERGDVIDIVKE